MQEKKKIVVKFYVIKIVSAIMLWIFYLMMLSIPLENLF